MPRIQVLQWPQLPIVSLDSTTTRWRSARARATHHVRLVSDFGSVVNCQLLPRGNVSSGYQRNLVNKPQVRVATVIHEVIKGECARVRRHEEGIIVDPYVRVWYSHPRGELLAAYEYTTPNDDALITGQVA